MFLTSRVKLHQIKRQMPQSQLAVFVSDNVIKGNVTESNCLTLITFIAVSCKIPGVQLCEL